MQRKPKTILFYSFKGGVGRTQLMLNVGKFLSEQKNKKVVLVDFDLYAPGLSYWLNNEVMDKKTKNEEFFFKYIIDFFSKNSDKEAEKNIFIKKMNSNLFLIPVYDMSNIIIYHKLLIDWTEYLYSLKQHVNEPLFDGYYTTGDVILEHIVNKITEQINTPIDYILFDARTGLTEISDLLFSNFIKLKIFISAYNKQNIEGTNSVLRLLSENNKEKHHILRILSMKPKINDKEIEKLKTMANLDQNISLKNKFVWHDIMEIDYIKELAIEDFDMWEKNEKTFENYKKQISNIANKIENIFEEYSLE